MDAGSLFTELLKQLDSIAAQQAQQEVNLIFGVDKEIKKLQQSFTIVQAMLNDAEKRQLTDNAVKLWLDQLRDVYYMMDDVLDKWNTARIKSDIQKEEERAVTNNTPAALKKKVPCSFFPSLPCCSRQVDNLSLRRKFGHKVENLKQTLDNILREKEKYGFFVTRHSHVKVDRPITSSIGDVFDIIGRDDYRDELLSNLLGVGSQEESNPHVISLVGMGGIGKSTLALLAYNHPKMEAHFHERMWVCVSNTFDQCKVAKDILQEVKHKSLNEVTEFETLLCEIHDIIREKKFFLVLDDVWTEDFTKWEPFRNVLKGGAQGSRILVTTRKNSVAKMMESSYMINLRELSLNDSLLIFSRIAFSNTSPSRCGYEKELCRELVNKCKGLPLAVRTLGCFMYGKSRAAWEMVLHSSLWEFEVIEESVFGPLLLSYNELSLLEKQCFLLCAAFPKDHLFDKLELIINWMAQGYIDSEENMKMEDIAEGYFEKLAMCSFFHDFEKDENDGRIKSCKMHAVVHEFAKSLTKDVLFTINCDNKVEKNFKRARQLSLIVKETVHESVYDAKNLRFLYLNILSSEIVQSKLFDYLTSLRTLHLEGKSTLELPNELEKLIHLRYLKLSCINLKELPETICSLCNLQSLDVRRCLELEKLPQRIGKLFNLRHLLLHDDCGIKWFPKGIGGLSCLRTLTYFSVSSEGEERCKLGELENLNDIQWSLKIVGLKNVADLGEVKNTFKKKTHVRVLTLCFNKEEDEDEEEDGRMVNDALILCNLEPPQRLESLTIVYYMGTTLFFDWMMYLTLKKLELSYCIRLECLPPLGKLPMLESLEILHAYSLEKVGDEFLGIEESKNKKDYDFNEDIVFPHLRSLRFEGLCNWEEWTGIGAAREEEEEEKDDGIATNTLTIMPRLCYLRIIYCPNLKSLPDFLRARTTLLQEWEMGEDKRGTGEEWSKISHIPNIKINHWYVQNDDHEVES